MSETELPTADSSLNTSTNLTRYNASREALIIAYSSMLTMALTPIIIGSIRSVAFHILVRETGNQGNTDIITKKKAMLFPFYASGVLFSFYLIFKYLPPDLVNLLISLLFTWLGVVSMSFFIEKTIVNRGFTQSVLFNLFGTPITALTILSFVFSGLFGGWYFMEKHWVANNLFGLTLATSAIETIPIQSVSVASIMMGGLFIYDIFWVFGTDVMVTVAKSFDAPIKLMFPLDFIDIGFAGKSHTMLGLGDIVVPGLLIAMFCRFDHSLKPGSKFYFYTSLISYILGMVVTIFVLTTFQAAQPALLYLVPACLGIPLMTAFLCGDLGALLKYEDYDEEELEGNKEELKISDPKKDE
ncbi:Minor histocompatibility antigen H13-like [Oopsacas minuta]|uniref:Minor histocompatibility antigen H13-like n=1 Tax=Oopsacas minuta TaxID=111878 RepID=A0AAV7JVN4_9METZ|nr:Minor histocompatibility antigen H13-like [Oopsacas minuta]